jgi:oligo-1,6-glucosidase
MLLEDDPLVYAFTRRLERTELLVVANFSGSPDVPADVPGWAGAELVLTNVAGRDPARMVLAPWEARVYRRGGTLA